MPNRYDVSVDGIEYRLIRGEGSYQQGASRAMVDFQEIETMEGSQLTSRNDVRALFQTSWAGGSRWEKPLLSKSSIDSYNISADFDMLVEPGSLLPRDNTDSTSSSPETNASVWVQTDHETAYAMCEGSSYYGVMKWVGGTISTITEHTNISTSSYVRASCWDEENSTLYFAAYDRITYCTPGVGQGDVLTGISVGFGASLFMHLGELHLYTGNSILKVEDPLGTPVSTTIFSDGFGHDWLDTISNTPTSRWLFRWSNNLSISTSDGIYMAKNVHQNGTVVGYIYRVDRDAAGTNIGTPVATLDPGYAIMDIFWSLGSLIISATSDIGIIGANDASSVAPRTEFFHLTQNGLGAIGAPSGNEPDEFIFKMLVSSQRTIYIGGSSNVWAYDPIRGGLHSLHPGSALSFAVTSGHYHSCIVGSDGIHAAHGNEVDRQMRSMLPYAKDTSTTTSPMLESNYFSFSLPGEMKYVTEVTLMPTDIQSGETWTVSLEADDGTFTSVATFTSGATQKAIFSAPVSGYRFRYKLEYATTSAQSTPSKLKGIMFRALSGEMVPFWQLMVDGTEARNVENEIVRPEDVFDNLKTLRDNKTPVTFVDNYEADDRSSSTQYTVRVHGVTITKEEPKEAVMQVVLVGT